MCVGTQVFSNGIYRLVDVRDVANAHIQAFEIPAANGRYCIVGGVTHYSELFNILHKFYPSLCLPKKWVIYLHDIECPLLPLVPFLIIIIKKKNCFYHP